MRALLVGADRLGNIPSVLTEYGIQDYIHWSGRKKGMRNFEIPAEIDMVIVFYDFIEHVISKNVKAGAKKHKIPCVFSKRACTDLAKQLHLCKGCMKQRCN